MPAPSGDFTPYEVISEIGRGGMGIVYKARDTRNDSTVAIKQLVFANIDPAKEKEFRDRFRREAATAARLSHPNIVTVFDVCMDNESNYFYVMELLEGHNLRRELDVKGGRLSPKEWWPIFSQTVEGLSFAHSMNVVHRDVKPDNIFILKDGSVKITDFGIARTADFEQTSLTKTGVMMGTLAYVSPEQLQDAKNVDHRADIFSLGVVSYEALVGEVPFTGEGIAQTIVKIVSQEETPLHIAVPFIDVHVSAVVSKALRKRARERYRTIKDFAKEYEQALEIGDRFRAQGEITKSHDAEPKDPSEMSLVERVKAFGVDALRIPDPASATAQDAPAVNASGVNYPPVGSSGLGPITSGTSFRGVASSGANMAGARFPEASQTPRLRPPEQGDYTLIKPLRIFNSCGKDQRKLIEPAALSYRSGRLIVADTNTRAIHMFTYDGRWTGDCVFKDTQDSKTGGGFLTKPSGLAIDVRGRIYACDSSDPYVRIFDSRGVFMKELCNIQGKDGGIQGIAIDSTGLLFLSDINNACIQVFQSDLALWMRKIGGKADGNGEFQLPAGLAIDRVNQLYCTDYGTSRVSIFNKTGAFIRSFGSKGAAQGLFNVPRAVAVDNNDKIYVLDSLNHRVQVFGPTGAWLYSFGGRGTEPGRFVGPSDLTIDAANNLLYVADKGNQRIQVFELCQT